jgi:hypothetical protein
MHITSATRKFGSSGFRGASFRTGSFSVRQECNPQSLTAYNSERYGAFMNSMSKDNKYKWNRKTIY